MEFTRSNSVIKNYSNVANLRTPTACEWEPNTNILTKHTKDKHFVHLLPEHICAVIQNLMIIKNNKHSGYIIVCRKYANHHLLHCDTFTWNSDNT